MDALGSDSDDLGDGGDTTASSDLAGWILGGGGDATDASGVHEYPHAAAPQQRPEEEPAGPAADPQTEAMRAEALRAEPSPSVTILSHTDERTLPRRRTILKNAW